MRIEPITIASVTVATTQTSAHSRNHEEDIAYWRASMRCHNCGIKLVLGSGSGQAARYSAHSGSSLSFTRSRSIRSIVYSSPRCRCVSVRLNFSRFERLQNSLTRPKQAHFQGILVHFVDLLQLLQRKPFHF